MAKKDKNKIMPPERELSDWQKRNIEFLKKKQKEEFLKAKATKELLAKRKSLMSKQSFEKELSAKEQKKKKKLKPVAKDERKALTKAIPIFLLSFLLLIGAGFFLTPYSQQKLIQVSGVKQTTVQDVSQATGIKPSDYLTSILLQTKYYEKNIEKNNPWIKKAKISYKFPNIFRVAVQEYSIYAYGLTDKGYRPILASGTRVDSAEAVELTEASLIVELTNKKQIKSLIQQLIKVDQQIVNQVRSISLVPSKATADLLQLEMYDGNLVRVPLSDISKKLPYYSKVSQQVEAGIIDMEVGIYRTTPELEAQSQNTSTASSIEEVEATVSGSSTTDESSEGALESSQEVVTPETEESIREDGMQ